MPKLTSVEQAIIKAAQTRTDWLNCSYAYLCEIFALRAKEIIDFREIDGQLQIRAREASDGITSAFTGVRR